MNPDRPVSSLLKTQIVHLQEAEFRLPVNRQTNIYINRIKTEVFGDNRPPADPSDE